MALTITSTVTLNNGVEMPLLGLGVWQIPNGPAAIQAVKSAIDTGYRLIDTAAAYGNEESVGQAIRQSGVDRSELFITTKVWNSDQGYQRTFDACRQSLEWLGLAHVDLYLIHWPVEGRWQGSWRALVELQQAGKCRAIGVSNFEISHLNELFALSDVVPAVNQVEFNPFRFRRELEAFCRQQDIELEAYSPLTRGMELGDPRVRQLAAKYHRTPAQILIRWPLQKGIVVIPKSANPQRIRENAGVFDFALSPEDMAMLDAIGPV